MVFFLKLSHEEKFVSFTPVNGTKFAIFSGSTNHSLGFEVAFDLINSSMLNTSTNIIYVSKGLLSSITEAKTVLEVIAAGQKNAFPFVIINTCALVDGKFIVIILIYIFNFTFRIP